jgi:hypothetical protein
VFYRFSRQFLLFFCVALSGWGCFLSGWGCPEVDAQTDTNGRQNRSDRIVRNERAVQNDRESRSNQPANSQVVLRDMQASLQKIPWDDVSPVAKTKIKQVVSGSPLFRRLPQQTVYADPEIYNFLLRHPDMVIGFWEHLGATQLLLREVRENQFLLKETTGTIAAAEILYQATDLCIVYAKGEYRGPLLAKGYQGDVVLILRTQFARDDVNEPMVVCDLDAFVQINSPGVDVLAKLFYSSLAKVADSNFEVTVAFVSQVSRAAARNTDALKETAEEISSIRQDVCTEFCEVVDRAAMRFARRNHPTPLGKQQQNPYTERSKESHNLLLSQSKPSEEWSIDHFFDSQPPLCESMDYERIGEFNVPQSIESRSAERTISKLPKPA